MSADDCFLTFLLLRLIVKFLFICLMIFLKLSYQSFFGKFSSRNYFTLWDYIFIVFLFFILYFLFIYPSLLLGNFLSLISQFTSLFFSCIYPSIHYYYFLSIYVLFVLTSDSLIFVFISSMKMSILGISVILILYSVWMF